MSFSNRPRFLYCGREKTVHDKRFLEALEEIGLVQEQFLNENSKPLSRDQINVDFDLVIAGPLTDSVASLPTGIDVPVVGISFAYDINEEIDEEKEQLNFQMNLSKLSAIIVDCHYIEKQLRDSVGFQKPVYMIPFGCDYEYFSDISFKMSSDLRILITRNWTKVHGNDVVLKALESIHGKVDFSAIFLGSGPQLEILSNQYGHLVTKHRIQFLGYQSKAELHRQFSSNWLYISGARSDGSSVSLMEAMSAGRICLTSDFPSNREWIENSYSGFTFSNGDAEDLASKLITIAQASVKTLKEIGGHAREKARVRGNWKSNRVFFQEAILRTLVDVR
jgi:glycosyltransferase involved in cell wall biosynthesis